MPQPFRDPIWQPEMPPIEEIPNYLKNWAQHVSGGMNQAHGAAQGFEQGQRQQAEDFRGSLPNLGARLGAAAQEIPAHLQEAFFRAKEAALRQAQAAPPEQPMHPMMRSQGMAPRPPYRQDQAPNPLLWLMWNRQNRR